MPCQRVLVNHLQHYYEILRRNKTSSVDIHHGFLDRV
jgi:hypothetical protein